MQDTLKIALIQSDLVWENPEYNLNNFNTKLDTVGEDVDLVVLPEMFSSGFTMNPVNVAETMKGAAINWMINNALEIGVAICGSLVIEEGSNYYNRFVFVNSDGSIHTYDKKHTFTMAGEDKVYKAGGSKVILDFKGWKICPLICYDLRFPVWARNTEDYDLLIYVANWPKPRINAWDILLQARAIENMAYCVGVNRIGSDANDLEYNGHSAVYDGLGHRILSFYEYEEGIKTIGIDKQHLQKIRNDLRFLEDRDEFSLITRK
jgi:predicted amidohydrolase